MSLRRGSGRPGDAPARETAGSPLDQPTRPREAVRFGNPYWVGLGIVLMVGGVCLNILSGLAPFLQAAWWAPIALGLLILTLVIR